MTHSDNSTTEESSNIRLGGIWMETEFPKSRRCLEMMTLFGPESFYWLCRIWGEIGEAKADRLSRRSIEIILAGNAEKDKLSNFLGFCVTESLLDLDGDSYSSHAITERKRKRARWLQADRDRQRSKRAKLTSENDSKEAVDITPDVRGTSDGHPMDVVISHKSKVISQDNKKVVCPPKFNPEGKTRYLDFVFLDDKQLSRVREYYTAKGLEPDDFWEAVRELDRWFSDNPKMRLKRCDDAKALMGWPLDNALKRRQNILRTEKMQSWSTNATEKNSRN